MGEPTIEYPFGDMTEPYDIERELKLAEYEENFLNNPDENKPDNSNTNRQENS
jgi:hypothetical protein